MIVKGSGIPAPNPGGKEETTGPANYPNYRCIPAVCRCAPGLELFCFFCLVPTAPCGRVKFQYSRKMPKSACLRTESGIFLL